MAKALDVIFNFLFHVCKEGFVKEGISLTGKHKVLPHKDTLFVAKLIEIVAFIVAAAPYTNHIHI